jgi:hypothetical protein
MVVTQRGVGSIRKAAKESTRGSLNNISPRVELKGAFLEAWGARSRRNAMAAGLRKLRRRAGCAALPASSVDDRVVTHFDLAGREIQQ